MKVRFFTEKDRDQVERFFQEEDFWRYEMFSAPGTDKLEVTQWDYIGVAEEKDEILGFVRFQICKNDNYIQNIYVGKAHRSNGVGSALLDFAEKRLKMCSDKTRIYLFTLDNSLMERILKKRGFKNGGTYKKHCYFNGRWQNQTLWQKWK